MGLRDRLRDGLTRRLVAFGSPVPLARAFAWADYPKGSPLPLRPTVTPREAGECIDTALTGTPPTVWGAMGSLQGVKFSVRDVAEGLSEAVYGMRVVELLARCYGDDVARSWDASWAGIPLAE